MQCMGRAESGERVRPGSVTSAVYGEHVRPGSVTYSVW